MLIQTYGSMATLTRAHCSLPCCWTRQASWFEGSDAKPDALTNGSIMRVRINHTLVASSVIFTSNNLTSLCIPQVGPIGLLAWRDPASPAAWANGVLSSHVTHQAPLCKEACAALGVAVAAAVRAKVRLSFLLSLSLPRFASSLPPLSLSLHNRRALRTAAISA